MARSTSTGFYEQDFFKLVFYLHFDPHSIILGDENVERSAIRSTDRARHFLIIDLAFEGLYQLLKSDPRIHGHFSQ